MVNANGVAQVRSVEITTHLTVTPKNQKSTKQTINAHDNGHENSMVLARDKLQAFGWVFEIPAQVNFP